MNARVAIHILKLGMARDKLDKDNIHTTQSFEIFD